jgi:hypothetical protein
MTLAVNIAQSGSNNQTFRNRIINGAMTIDQRNAGAATASSYVGYTLDRYNYQASDTGKFVFQQNAGSVTPPTGFTNYLGATSQSSFSVGTSGYFSITQNIEGYNIADLGWGTANAQPVTLSFWVRSSLTGTFGVAFRNNAADRNYQASYTISSANTWEQKTITIAGDTSGTWVTNNGTGLRVTFGLGVGSNFSTTAGAWGALNYFGLTGATSVVGTSGATFYITGVQLEEGTAASPFENRLYGTELLLCQRYYTMYRAGTAYGRLLSFGLGVGGTLVRPSVQLPVRMRAAASSVDFGGALRWYNGSAVGTVSSVSIDTANDTVIGLNCTTTGASAGQAYMINDSGDNTAYIGINAEL